MRTAAFGIAAVAASLFGWGSMPVAHAYGPADQCVGITSGPAMSQCIENALKQLQSPGYVLPPPPPLPANGPISCDPNGTPAQRAVCGDQDIMGQPHH